MPPPADIETARRALNAIKDGGHPSQADALALRLWSGPKDPSRPLAEIAYEIIKLANEPGTHF